MLQMAPPGARCGGHQEDAQNAPRRLGPPGGPPAGGGRPGWLRSRRLPTRPSRHNAASVQEDEMTDTPRRRLDAERRTAATAKQISWQRRGTALLGEMLARAAAEGLPAIAWTIGSADAGLA